jgi:hypothetical protein
MNQAGGDDAMPRRNVGRFAGTSSVALPPQKRQCSVDCRARGPGQRCAVERDVPRNEEVTSV